MTAQVIENDKDISNLLAAGEDDSVMQKMPSLIGRFREDHNSNVAVFERLVESSIYPSSSYATATAAPASLTSLSLPQAFQGLQDIVPLLQTLLNTTEAVAIRTLAIKNDTNDAGSLPFLLDCVDIYYHQRAARIGAISDLISKSSHELLDVVDQSTTSARGLPRGLFRMLLSSVCQQLDILLPPSSLVRRPARFSSNNDWNDCLGLVRDRRKIGLRLERSEALAALLVLLYDFMPVDPVDLAVLLAAFSKPRDDNSNLVSLILAESVALWRTLDGSNENLSPWQELHPLLRENATQDQLRNIMEILLQGKNPSWALVTLSLGLLLHASSGPLAQEGFQLAKLANSELDAFNVLHSIMSETVVPIVPAAQLSLDTLWSEEEFDHDFPISAESESSSSVLAATIGREILSATLLSFRELLLPEGKLPPLDDIGRIASTAMVIFQNSPTLCSDFWVRWNKSTNSPLAQLLRAAYRLAEEATKSAKSGFGDRDEILRAMTPLLQLLSALSFNPDDMGEIFGGFLPGDIIRCAVELLQIRSPSETDGVRRKILCSLATLSKFASSNEKSRSQLRSAFESYTLTSEPAGIDGPRSLVKILQFSDKNSNQYVFAILANIAGAAPPEWILDCIGALKLVQHETQAWMNSLESKTTSLHLVKLVNTILRRIHELVFNGALDEAVIEQILETIHLTTRALGECLVSCGHDKMDHGLAACIMDGISLLLRQWRPIAHFHRSEQIRNTFIHASHEHLQHMHV